MARLTLRAEAGSTVELDLEWGAESGGEREFRLVAGETVLDGVVALGEDGGGWVRCGERVVSFYAVRLDEELEVWLDGEVYRFALPRPERARRAGGQVLAPGGEVSAPMPGQVLEVLVSAGDRVAAGAALVRMESMKLQLAVSSPGEGEVVEVRCVPGEMVDVGQVLVRIA